MKGNKTQTNDEVEEGKPGVWSDQHSELMRFWHEGCGDKAPQPERIQMGQVAPLQLAFGLRGCERSTKPQKEREKQNSKGGNEIQIDL